MKEFENQNMLDLKEPIQISAGEITISPNKTEILDYLQKYPLQIFTNALIFDKQIADITAKEGSFLNISIDAGTRATYKLVKGMDAYEKLKDNIRKYKKSGSHMELKYIILFENCDKENTSGFMELCKEIKPDVINISTDLSYDHRNLDVKILDAAFFISKEAKKAGIKYRILKTLGQNNIKKIEKTIGE